MENLILSLLAPIGLTLFRAGQSQSKNLVKSLTKPFFHLSIGEYQISFLNCTVKAWTKLPEPEVIWYQNNVEVTSENDRPCDFTFLPLFII